MTLISPGVQVTVIDESQYIPAATNSVPYVLLATAQDKASGAGVGIAPGTLPENANKTYLLTSQRDLLATFGVPSFYTTSSGTPINGYELNEYGLLAAYSALGISNRCYVQRVNINLDDLTASLVRPLGAPNNNTYWLDTANSNWGIFQWNQVTGAFTNFVPLVITDTASLEIGSTTPLQSIGSIGNYSVTATSIYNPIYYKRGGPTALETTATQISDLYNNWVLLGSDDWKTSWPTVTGTLAPSTLTANDTIIINGTVVTVPAGPNNTVTGLMTAINSAAITGVYAAVQGGKLTIYGDSTAVDSSVEGTIAIANGFGTPLTVLGIVAGTYAVPVYQASPSYQVPRWRVTDTVPEPTGSVWQKTNNVNLGTNLVVKKYNSTLSTFVQQAAPVYTNDATAIYGLDPTGGGTNIPAGATYAQVAPTGNNTAGFELFQRYGTGATVITGSDATPGPFISGNSFDIMATAPGQSTYNTGTAVLLGTTADDFVAAISAADIPYITAYINSSGAIVITHLTGGSIVLSNVLGTPVTTAGFTTSVRGVKNYFVDGAVAGIQLSNWVGTPTFQYIASSVAPDQDPSNGTLWYYSAINQADILIQNNGQWFGYQNVINDVRGYDLSATNATGPIFSATAPQTQTDEAASPLVYGDLWIDTSDLENYPVISRWQNYNGEDQWVLLDNTDQTTENGIIFEDARWATNGSTNPISDPIPTITSLLTSNYLDLDAPNALLYPQGMLLFNTRRSGYNVKSFEVNYFNSNTFPSGSLPAQKNAWVTASSNNNDGSPNMGRHAQRIIIVKALKSGIDTSSSAREESINFNLLACPQYPELLPNLIALNNERSNTAFVIGDTPLRLTPAQIVDWANNTPIKGYSPDELLTTASQYAGVWYPSCRTNDLSGNLVVQPPSHMMIRTIIRNDSVAYPWMAPAGTRRGVVDNALQLGYIKSQTGEFEVLTVNQGIRDVLYEHAVNPITFIPGVGITNYGNKTVTSIASALDRINVARLVAFIRNRLEYIGKQYLFEPNDQITRNQFSNAVNSLMIDLVAKRGVYDYLIVCDLTNNTPARIDRNELWLDLAIEPVKAVEFIYIPVRIMNTGAIAATSTV